MKKINKYQLINEIDHLGQVGAFGDPQGSRSDADKGCGGHLQDGWI